MKFATTRKTYRFKDAGQLGQLLLPAGVYDARTEHGREGRVTHVTNGDVQHALVRPNEMKYEVKMKEPELRARLAEIVLSMLRGDK